MTLTDRQRMLARAHGQLYADVATVVRAADPMQLIAVGAPDDEYDAEVSTILPRLKEAKSSLDVMRIVHEEFAHWFGDDMAGALEEYEAVSIEIWEAWRHHCEQIRD